MNQQWKNGKKTRGIEWCDVTWNVTGGCMHGCRWQMPDGTVAICYAEEIANNVARAAYAQGFEHHYFRPGQLGVLERKTTPLLIFGDSMSDLFGNWVPDEHVVAVLDEIRNAPQHIVMILTKNAPRIARYTDQIPDNCWIGVSSPPDWMWGKRLSRDQQKRMLSRQLDVLKPLYERGIVTWMSIEPLSWDIAPLLENAPLKWAVIGAATNGKKKYQPEMEHVTRALEVLDDNGTAVFFKGNLEWPHQWREDFPAIYHPALIRRQRNCEERGWQANMTLPSADECERIQAERVGELVMGDVEQEQRARVMAMAQSLFGDRVSSADA